MNKHKVRGVALALLTGKLPNRRRSIGYNQRKWRYTGGEYPDHSGRGCGTVCCVAGWTTALYAPQEKRPNKISSCARKILKLTRAQADALFTGSAAYAVGREPTSKDAAMVLFNFAETGKVNWEIAK